MSAPVCNLWARCWRCLPPDFWRAGFVPNGAALLVSQITNFTDSAVAPALSHDGRVLAFLRSDRWWLTEDQIYVKLLPLPAFLVARQPICRLLCCCGRR